MAGGYFSAAIINRSIVTLLIYDKVISMKKVNNVPSNELALLASSGTLTITPNNRTSAVLTNHVVTLVLNETKKIACKMPNIQPLGAWVESVFSKLRASNVEPFSSLALIGNNELVSYWVRAMHFDSIGESLINPSEWLSDALSADKVLSRWQVKEYSPDSVLSESFKRWRVSVQRDLLSKGYVTQSMAIELLITAIRDGKVAIPKLVALYAFDEKPPLYQALFDAISEQSELREVSPLNNRSKWFKVSTQDAHDQLDTVARWASNIVENEPTKTIAIISPDLKKSKKAILKSLNNVFEPQWILPESGVYTAPYDVSLGQGLKKIPFFNRALFYLGITGATVNSEDVLNIITDPFTAPNKTEALERRKFAKKMRDNRGLKTSLLSLAMKSYCPPILSKSLNDFTRVSTMHPGSLLPSRWANLFNNSLKSLGWGVGVKLNEIEAAGIDKWKGALDALSCLDIHTGEIPRELAVKLLEQYCINTLVTPHSKGSPISVLGSLEAAGLNYDYMWVLDCNDNVFPAPASLNTCLPVALQIDNKMPHSSGEREFEFTQQLFARYTTSCSEFYTSYITNDQYGTKKPASILNLADAKVEKEILIDKDIIDYKSLTYKQFGVTEENDEIGRLAISGKKVDGGVSVIDQMQQCGMQAITSKRLKVDNHKPNYTMGFTGTERGEMLHNALENFWAEVINISEQNNASSHSAELHSLSEARCLSLIEQSVDVAFFWVDREDINQQLIEQERLLMISTLSQWIEVEKQRTDFNIIAMEKTDCINLGGFQLKIRKDRLDEVIVSVNSKKTLALDNKSSEELVGSAFSSSPKSQLPLAALSDNADGFGYLNVVPNSPNISGIINDEQSDDLPLVSKHGYKVSKDWEKLKEFWRELFSEKIKQYVNGDVAYSPSAKACIYCVKRSLCNYAVG